MILGSAILALWVSQVVATVRWLRRAVRRLATARRPPLDPPRRFDLPVVLAVSIDDGPPRACACLCTARHPNAMGICAGITQARPSAHPGVRVHLNSTFAPATGIVICRPCAGAWPDINLGSVRHTP